MGTKPCVRIPKDDIRPWRVDDKPTAGMVKLALIIHENELDIMFKLLESFRNAGKSLGMKQTGFHTLLLIALISVQASAAQSGIPLRGPDYFRDASDLASTLGAAHAIRVRCNGRNDQYWRRYMADMLKYEAPERGNLRRSLVDAFNEAYSSASQVYQSCDNRAVEAEAEFSQTGREIATRMATHYFPKDTRER